MHRRKNLEKKNYRIFVASNSLMSFASGLLGPFYVVFVEKIGGMETFGLAMGIMIFYSLSGYSAGKYSDVFGRKIFLVGSGITASIIIFSYTLISSVLELMIFLQIINGIASSVYQIMETSLRI
jgi:MFS family permease